MRAVGVPLLIGLLAQTSWPVSFVLSKFNLMGDQSSIFIAGVICLILSALFPILVFKYHVSNVDPLMYVFSVFAWTCMIDLGIALELDGIISNFIGYYFAEGEPYLKTAHGTAINYWDGTAHFVLYIGMIYLYMARKSHREAGLFWAGSIINSLIVLVPGGITGNHPFKMSILLNVPYMLLPVLAVFKFFNEKPPQSRTFLRYKPIWHRPIDLLFALYFVAAIGVTAFRGMAALGGNAEAMKWYLKSVEPYMTDPSNFARLQVIIYEHCFLPYYLAAIYGLVYPGQHWMADWALLHAGAAAQGQYSYIMASVHHRTAKSLRAPMAGRPGLIFWAINIALTVFPQLFAWRCLSDYEKFGRTYNVEKAELKESTVQVVKTHVAKKAE